MYFFRLATNLAVIPAATALSASLIYQFPPTPYYDIENVAVRPSGALLFTSINHAEVQMLEPDSPNPTPSVVYQFPGANATAGIAQYSFDEYAVVVGEYNFQTFAGIPDSFSIWTMSLRGLFPVATKIAAITSAHALNGLTAVPSNPNIVLVADSVQGAVYSVNIATGAYSIAISNANFAPTATFPLGINGIHVSGSTLYFTNSAQGLYGSIPIDTNGVASGPVSIISHSPTNQTYDDFALDANKNAYIATHPNELLKVTTGGPQSTVAGGGSSSQLNQPTSAIFGQGQHNCTLYIVTAGNDTLSGQILSAQTC